MHKYGEEVKGVRSIEGSRIMRELIALQRIYHSRGQEKVREYAMRKTKQLKSGPSLQFFPSLTGR